MILITGHKGFVGKHLTKLLDKNKIKWIGYDLKDGKDIRNSYELYEFFDFYRPEIVIHLAALAGIRRGEEYPEEYISTNVVGTLNVVKNCEKFGVKKLINFSSSSVYGECTCPIAEDAPKNPANIYGLTKLFAEILVRKSKIPTRFNVRPFTIYGLNGRVDQVIYIWLNQIREGKPISIFGDGTSQRGYTHVEDLCEGVLKMMNSEVIGYMPMNLGGSEIISLGEMIKIFSKNIKNLEINELPMPNTDVMNSWANIDLAKDVLGWSPKRKFANELKKIIKNEKI